MTEPDWDRILTLGVSLGEQAEKVAPPNEGPRVAAAAYAWVLLRGLWNGEDVRPAQRWREDMPELIGHYAERLAIERLRVRKE
ncbi:MAG TPA: hypothetical protein VL974_16195 [Magnetospirillum sp.]|jgi:hypothetical protein|nr:hypothetical protein [Magnetospirillum sp.]